MSMWDRQRNFINNEQQDCLKNSTVLVAGIGANGSVAAEDLVRVGIGNIILADPDVVELNNLNRQNYTSQDIGRLKVDSLKSRLKSIHPSLSIETIKDGVTTKNINNLITKCDIVLDCCDNYPAKILLSRRCAMNQIPLVHSAGGAVRGAVTVFNGDLTYEAMFGLPSLGVADSDLEQIDFTSHRKTVVNRFGANLFDKKTKSHLSSKAYVQWPTMVGACNIAAHISVLQTVWLAINTIEHIIYAPNILLFDARTLEFTIKNFFEHRENLFQ